MDQSNRYADLSLNEAELIKGGKHILVAYHMSPAEGHGYLEAAAHFAAESSTGTNVEVSTTDEFTKGVDALVYFIDEVKDVMKIAYPSVLFDRNITDGRVMIVSFLTWRSATTRAWATSSTRKMHDFYVPPQMLMQFRRSGKRHFRPVAHSGSPGSGRRLHLRHHHQAQAGSASRAIRQGGIPVLAGRRLHQERRATRQPGILPAEKSIATGLRLDEARAWTKPAMPSCSR